jgi:hypothetical protein
MMICLNIALSPQSFHSPAAPETGCSAPMLTADAGKFSGLEKPVHALLSMILRRVLPFAVSHDMSRAKLGWRRPSRMF